MASVVQDLHLPGLESNSALQAAGRSGLLPDAALPEQPGTDADDHPGSKGGEENLH
ncbi:hypothetical protein GDO78_015421 [Eleutherodactylus coqui]|uniref:Uncharacterized protein n=1 Tax=Eleutherodactylus coqui TaxID=57060 RepID=A0A8J6EDS8_ELECQ|nr:hypothetical protein GDO78_015421 [Eleutherodactylus coqui]KAG9467206.1 hypothetical protein GDO78_015421 [Eleutherodactylus coqui]